MESDQEQMERKRTISLAILVIVIILGAIIYYLWGNLINQGKIKITGNAPFAVEVYEVQTINCPTSPCQLTAKSGSKQLILSKDGYTSLLKQVDVPLWRTVDVAADFAVKPHFEKITQQISEPDAPAYKFIPDKTTGMQKLVLASDASETALVYFPKEITSEKIFGSPNAVLLIDTGSDPLKAYKVDLLNKTKSAILNPEILQRIRLGKWSKDGKYFAFSIKQAETIWLLNDQMTLQELPLTATISQVAWDDADNLLFATRQGFDADGNLIANPETPAADYTFGSYYPAANKYQSIATYTDGALTPESFVATGSGNELYFKSGGEGYRLVLK